MGELAQLPRTDPYGGESETVTPRKLNLRCTGCGYGVLRATPPPRCPMCQAENAWIQAAQRPVRNRHTSLPA
jgi:rubrerythrin